MSCICCNDTQFRQYLRKNIHDIVICASCGFKYVFPIPEQGELINQYDRDYFLGEGKHSYDDYVGNKILYIEEFKERLDFIHKFTFPPGKLLYIGSAAGFLLEVAKGRGWTVEGIKIAKEMVDYVRLELGIQLIHGTVDSLSLTNNEYDLAVMFDVLQHIQDPFYTLTRLNSSLKPGGFIAITVPNPGSWLGVILGRKWPHYTPPEHIYYFSQRI